jgi:methyl-accepting chemotaxis protein
MLGNLRISYKLMMMVGLSVFAIAAVAGVGLSALWSNLLEDRKAKLQDVVLMARQALDLNYQASRQAGVSEAEAVERGKAVLRTFRFGKDDYFYALNAQGVVVANPNPKVEGKNLYDAPDSDGVFFVRKQLELAADGGGFVSYRFPRASGGEPLPKMVYAAEFKPYGWVIGGGVYLDDVQAIFWAQARQIGMLVGLGLVLVAGLFLLLGRSIVNPINAMTASMRKIAAGETSTVIPALERSDEVGAMAQSVQIFKDNMIEATRLRGEQDVMKAQADTERKLLLSRMADEFERGVRASLDTLAGAATEMQTTSKSMSATAGEASVQATTVAAVAEQASANVQTVAAATEELSSSVSEIGRQVTQSTEIAGQAVAEANRTNVTVQGLSAAAQKIGDVVKLISDIASQRRDRGSGAGHRGYRPHDRRHQRDYIGDFGRRRTTGGRDTGDRPQRSASRARHRPGIEQHLNRQPGGRQDGVRGQQGAVLGRATERPGGNAARRRRSLPRQYSRRLKEPPAASVGQVRTLIRTRLT